MTAHLIEWADELITPPHAGETVNGTPVQQWTCRCGAAGLTEDAATGHVDEHAATAIKAMPPAVLGAALLESAVGDAGRVAATRLLIGHEYWLRNGYLRALMSGRWNAEGRLCVSVGWRRIASMITVFDGPLWALALPDKLADAMREAREAAIDADDPARNIMTASSGQLRMLAIACSLGGAMPIVLSDSTAGLDRTNRGLVLAAVWHMLSGGGEITLAVPPAWADNARRET